MIMQWKVAQNHPQTATAGDTSGPGITNLFFVCFALFCFFVCLFVLFFVFVLCVWMCGGAFVCGGYVIDQNSQIFVLTITQDPLRGNRTLDLNFEDFVYFLKK